MLTSLPPRALHVIRDAAATVHDLAQLGLELLCPCGGQHSDRLGELSTPPATVPFQPHRFANGVTCWCGAEHWRGRPNWGPNALETPCVGAA